MAATPLGRICWYELMTTDPHAAQDFYGAIAGWGTAPFDGGDKPYTMWTNGDIPIGGVMELPDEAKAAGAPPHWLAHISTPDVEATAKQATQLGGTVLMGPHAIPSVGSFAIIQDPQGAVFSAYQPEDGAPGHDGPPVLGEISWNELMTTDWEGAWTFYSTLFGWRKGDSMDMGPMGLYQMFDRGNHPLGGMFNKPEEMPMAAWLYYILVPDADAAVVKIRSLGGTIMNGPMDIPGGGRIAQCMDPQGAAFAVHSEQVER